MGYTTHLDSREVEVWLGQHVQVVEDLDHRQSLGGYGCLAGPDANAVALTKITNNIRNHGQSLGYPQGVLGDGAGPPRRRPYASPTDLPPHPAQPGRRARDDLP